jgi:Fe-S oxidoreductase
MMARFVIGLLLSVVCLGIAGRRLLFLVNLGKKFQPLEADRTPAVGAAVKAEVAEVAGQRKLLRWTVPGVAHFMVFWGFMILLFTVVEAFFGLVKADFQMPFFGNWPWFGFVEDLFAIMCVLALAIFTVLRIQQAPKNLGRRSRFFGSHIGPAWFVLFMIFNVVWTLLAYRGASINAQELHEPQNADKMGFLHGAFASQWFASILPKSNVEFWETFLLLLSLSVLLGFTVFVTYSKHMHIFASIPNVAYARRPRALGALEPVYWQGKKIDFEDPGEDDVMGVGKVEDFTWKGLLDFATCTECGRCQSQCPAWNTDKPLSPKVLIMGLRDHALAKAPYLMATKDADGNVKTEGLAEAAVKEGERPLVGPEGDETASVGEHGIHGEGAIPFDMLWSCTTCGACVEQCPVDIEHVDHIVDMRRYQVLMEGAFPEEAGIMLNNVEHAGDPWGLGRTKRLEWAEELDFEIRVYEGDKIPDDVEYLFWVGCAGALDDTAKRTSRAVATLLHEAGVEFMILGEAESCTGDPARRMGHEFLYQMMAMQNVEVLNEAGAKRIVVTCAHCYNALANEYPQAGGHYEVVHHTTLLARLVAERKLTPVQRVDAAVTYHDPCYLGRHNRIFAAPREVLGSVPGTRVQEMPRNQERSFCCGAGGARMWMDENLGTRINQNRADEAIATKPDLITAACPFCITMLSDGVAQRQQEGTAASSLEVTDVAEVLLRSIRPDLASVATGGGEST